MKEEGRHKRTEEGSVGEVIMREEENKEKRRIVRNKGMREERR